MSGGNLVSWKDGLASQVATVAKPFPVQVVATDPLGSIVQGAQAVGLAVTSGGLRIMTKGQTGLAQDIVGTTKGEITVADTARGLQTFQDLNVPTGSTTSSVIDVGVDVGTSIPWAFYSIMVRNAGANAVGVIPQASFDNITFFDLATSTSVNAASVALIVKVPCVARYYRTNFTNAFAPTATPQIGTLLSAA